MGEAINIMGFPVTGQIALKGRGEHQGIGYEIVNHNRNDYKPDGTWCYYVIVMEAMLSADEFNEFWLEPHGTDPQRSGFSRPSYSYYDAKFAAADWHGGVTFYEKAGGHDGQQRYVKIGCDFAHLWDEGRSYDYADVERECVQTIEQLRAMYEFRRRCHYYGSYHHEAEMVEHKGRLYSKAGVESMLKAA